MGEEADKMQECGECGENISHNGDGIDGSTSTIAAQKVMTTVIAVPSS